MHEKIRSKIGYGRKIGKIKIDRSHMQASCTTMQAQFGNWRNSCANPSHGGIVGRLDRELPHPTRIGRKENRLTRAIVFASVSRPSIKRAAPTQSGGMKIVRT
jgi:hypothetical protein